MGKLPACPQGQHWDLKQGQCVDDSSIPSPYEPPTDNKLYDLLFNVFGTGQTVPKVDIVNLTTGAAFQQLTNGKVKKAIIQNISNETVTLTTFQAATGGIGILLDSKGSLPCGNVDLSYFWFTRNTAGITLAVYSEA